jgi:hypothetical protein
MYCRDARRGLRDVLRVSCRLRGGCCRLHRLTARRFLLRRLRRGRAPLVHGRWTRRAGPVRRTRPHPIGTILDPIPRVAVGGTGVIDGWRAIAGVVGC